MIDIPPFIVLIFSTFKRKSRIASGLFECECISVQADRGLREKKMKAFFEEFKKFALKGNMMDMAVGAFYRDRIFRPGRITDR